MSGILTYQSGQAVTINCAVTTTSGEGCYALPNRSTLYAGAKTVAHWFNAASFLEPGCCCDDRSGRLLTSWFGSCTRLWTCAFTAVTSVLRSYSI